MHNWILGYAPDLIIVYGAPILKGSWLNSAKFGIINMHYGWLPNYRSSHSPLFALYHEEFDKVGASIHYINSGIDTGEIISRRCIPLENGDSYETTMAKVYEAGAIELLDVATSILNGENIPKLKIEKVPLNRYYPSKLYSTFIESVARLHLEEYTQKKWPYKQDKLENLANNFSFNFSDPLDDYCSALPNGIYILLYHGIVDIKTTDPYSKVHTYSDHFLDHLDYLLNSGFKPITLSQAPGLLNKGHIDEKYLLLLLMMDIVTLSVKR